MTLAVEWVDAIPMPPGTPVFESRGAWSLYRPEGCYEFVLWPSATPEPNRAAIVDASFRYGKVLLKRNAFATQSAVYPLASPLEELLVIHRLARGEGVEVHACGVLDERGRGLLFVGSAGAGKSTMARLWQQSGARVLGDDRIILRRDPDPASSGRVLMHGAPWHGKAHPAPPISAPLCGVNFLEHGSRNELEQLSADRAAAHLLARCFLPMHDVNALGLAADFVAGLCDVPQAIFRFVPDDSAVRMFENDAQAA